MKHIEIFLRKLILRLFLLFYPELKKTDKIKLDSKLKVLLIRLNRIGDALVTTPLLYFLKSYTNHEIIVVASKYNYFVFNNSLVDRVIKYDKSNYSFFRLIKEINKISPDIIIDLHEDVSTTVSFIIGFSKSKYKVGFYKKNYKLYNYTLPKQDTEKTHVIDRLLNFLKLFNININNQEINVIYKLSENSLNKISNFIKSNNLENKFIMGVNISAGSDARFWSIENYIRLVNELKNSYEKIEIIILCTKNDLQKARKIAQNRFLIFFNDSFEIFSAFISKLNLLITPDTSIVHIASAFKIPVFGLYVKYKTKDMIWSPYKSKFEYVFTEHATLKDIEYENVIKKLKPFIESLLWKN